MKIKSQLAVFMMMGLVATAGYATNASCLQDTNQMLEQITQYGSITSPIDRYQFTHIADPVSKGQSCRALGYWSGWLICTVDWEAGNWGNTFRCIN